jgi:hypothetical protein
MLPLASTLNKTAIRQRWDKPIIVNFAQETGKRLAYFGLPGPDLKDILDWRDFLGWKTGIEYVPQNGSATIEQRQKINQLQTNIMLNRLNQEWELRRGSLEDIILNGADVDGNRPAFLVVERNQILGLRYDLHNWDFQGGIGYKSHTRSDSKRIEAIKRCIQLQRTHPFLFLLTVNVRHTLGEELSNYLTGQAKEIQSREHQSMLSWYASRGSSDYTEHYRLKAVVPLFIRQVAGVHSFDCYAYPPIYYQGPKEHLLHFVFGLLPRGTVLPCFSNQQLTEVVEMPLVEMKEGEFTIPDQQHISFALEKAQWLLEHLGLPSKY